METDTTQVVNNDKICKLGSSNSQQNTHHSQLDVFYEMA